MLVTRAWLHLQEREFAQAIVCSRAARNAGFTGPVLLTNMGYAHAALGNVDKAIKLTREAASLAPQDRRIGFNLAGYYRMVGAFDSALAQLERLKVDGHTDIDLALAIADLYVEIDDSNEAYRTLRRVRTSGDWVTADKVRRSELEANLAFLRWMTRREDVEGTITEVHRALRACDFQSLAIAHLLMNLVRKPTEVDLLERVINELAVRHRDEDFVGLRTHLAVLRHASDDAVSYARQWAEHDFLNPIASAVAVQLLTDLVGNEAEAVEVGISALRRAPTHPFLINNTAYALALADRPEEAKRILKRLGERQFTEVAPVATRALADWVAGDAEAGEEGYRRAHSMAEARNNASLAVLVKLNAAMAARRHCATTGWGEDFTTTLLSDAIPAQWAERPDFWITGHRLKRELGVSLSSLLSAD